MSVECLELAGASDSSFVGTASCPSAAAEEAGALVGLVIHVLRGAYWNQRLEGVSILSYRYCSPSMWSLSECVEMIRSK